jgi:hypothetical protein
MKKAICRKVPFSLVPACYSFLNWTQKKPYRMLGLIKLFAKKSKRVKTVLKLKKSHQNPYLIWVNLSKYLQRGITE